MTKSIERPIVDNAVAIVRGNFANAKKLENAKKPVTPGTVSKRIETDLYLDKAINAGISARAVVDEQVKRSFDQIM